MVKIKGRWYRGLLDYIVLELGKLTDKYNNLQKEALTSGKYELVKAYSNVIDDIYEILLQICNDKEEE